MDLVVDDCIRGFYVVIIFDEFFEVKFCEYCGNLFFLYGFLKDILVYVLILINL